MGGRWAGAEALRGEEGGPRRDPHQEETQHVRRVFPHKWGRLAPGKVLPTPIPGGFGAPCILLVGGQLWPTRTPDNMALGFAARAQHVGGTRSRNEKPGPGEGASGHLGFLRQLPSSSSESLKFSRPCPNAHPLYPPRPESLL